MHEEQDKPPAHEVSPQIQMSPFGDFSSSSLGGWGRCQAVTGRLWLGWPPVGGHSTLLLLQDAWGGLWVTPCCCCWAHSHTFARWHHYSTDLAEPGTKICAHWFQRGLQGKNPLCCCAKLSPLCVTAWVAGVQWERG